MIKKIHQNYLPYSKALVLLVLLNCASCAKNNQETAQQQQKPEVDFYEVKVESGEVDKKYPAIIEGTVNVDVKAQVTGYLSEIFVKEGQYVTKGQSLFRIKGDVFQEQVNNSAASYKSAMAALTSAKLEVEKIRPLVEAKVYSAMQLKTAEANYEAAEANAAQAKAALGSSQLTADFSLIKAPVSGFIGRIPNRIGNLVYFSHQRSYILLLKEK